MTYILIFLDENGVKGHAATDKYQETGIKFIHEQIRLPAKHCVHVAGDHNQCRQDKHEKDFLRFVHFFKSPLLTLLFNMNNFFSLTFINAHMRMQKFYKTN